MANDLEKFEKQERAARLKKARQAAGFAGPTDVHERSKGRIDINSYKGHESGRNGFSVSDAKVYADLFEVPLVWLYLGMGSIDDFDIPGSSKALKDAFARVAAVPAVHETVLRMIDFALSQVPAPSLQQPSQQHGRRDSSKPRHASESSR